MILTEVVVPLRRTINRTGIIVPDRNQIPIYLSHSRIFCEVLILLQGTIPTMRQIMDFWIWPNELVSRPNYRPRSISLRKQNKYIVEFAITDSDPNLSLGDGINQCRDCVGMADNQNSLFCRFTLKT